MRWTGWKLWSLAGAGACGLLWCGLTCAAPPKPEAKQPREADVRKMEAALPGEAPARPQKPRKVLVFGLARGFVHSSIPLGARTIQELGQKTGAWEATISYDPADFNTEKLQDYDAVVLVSTTGNFLDDPDPAVTKRRHEALLEFVRGGKGLAGIHAATDANYGWREYGELMGGSFNGHPWNEKVGIKVDDPRSPLTRMFEKNGLDIADEIYQFTPKGKDREGREQQTYARDRVHVLLSLDLTTPGRTAAKGKGTDFPVAWIRQFGKGRVFYCSLGHREEVYWNPVVLRFYLAGIQYTLGDLKADATPETRSAAASR